MIEQTGQLIRIAGDRAWVRLGGQAGCPACDAGRGCGAGLFGRLLRRRPVELALDNAIGARVGQAVTVGLPESAYLSLVWRIYALPLLAGLAGALISHQILQSVVTSDAVRDATTLAGGIAFAVLSGSWSRRRPVSALAEAPVQLLAATPGLIACGDRDDHGG